MFYEEHLIPLPQKCEIAIHNGFISSAKNYIRDKNRRINIFMSRHEKKKFGIKDVALMSSENEY